jgi:hypothetical protein
MFVGASEPVSALDWVDVSVNAVTALATLAAVIFSVRQAQKADQRADEAERRAQAAEDRQQTLDEANIRRRDEDLRTERLRVLADLEKERYWLKAAESYGDHPRVAEGQATVRAAEVRLRQIADALQEPVSGD